MPTLTHERLIEVLNYNPETGLFVWRKRIGPRVTVGAVAGSIFCVGHSDISYWSIRIDKKLHLSHRLAWLYVNGAMPDCYVDHVNGDGLDNRIKNLRLCSHKENMRNSRMRKNNSAGVKGIRWDAQRMKWRADIRVDGKSINLGRFDSKEAAKAAYAVAADKYHGDFARLE